MSTRANIKFQDKWDTYYIDSSHDGFPNNILPDIQKAIEFTKGKWSGSELGQFISYFLGMNYDPKRRIQVYEPCSGIAGDESCCYWVNWDEESQEYKFGLDE